MKVKILNSGQRSKEPTSEITASRVRILTLSKILYAGGATSFHGATDSGCATRCYTPFGVKDLYLHVTVRTEKKSTHF